MQLRKVLIAFVGAALSTFSACSEENAASPRLYVVGPGMAALANGTLIDGTGCPPVPDAVVAIKDGRVAWSGPRSGVEIQEGAVVMDAGGGWILPGLINAHVHHCEDAPTRRLYLERGVTSICDFCTPIQELPGLRDIRYEGKLAARCFSSGPGITAPEGYPGAVWRLPVVEVANPDQARNAVDRLATAGADMVKSFLEPGPSGSAFPHIDLATLKAIAAAAHSRDLLLHVHSNREFFLDWLIEADVDVIEHIPAPTGTVDFARSAMATGGKIALPPEFERKLRAFASSGACMTPTITVIDSKFRSSRKNEPQELKDAYLGVLLSIVRVFHESGGRISVGDDYDTPGLRFSAPVRELQYLMSAGLSSMDAIVSGTRDSGYASGHGDLVGSLEPGKYADILVLEADPLVDISNFERIRAVLLGGELAFGVLAAENPPRGALLIDAVRRQDEAQCKLLLARGCDPNATDSDGLSALNYAAHQGSLPLVRALLAAGADVNGADPWGMTSLHAALKEGWDEVATALIVAGADVNAQVGSGFFPGFSPLHTAVFFGKASSDTIVLLLARGADRAARDAKGRTAVDMALQSGASRIANMISKYGN